MPTTILRAGDCTYVDEQYPDTILGNQLARGHLATGAAKASNTQDNYPTRAFYNYNLYTDIPAGVILDSAIIYFFWYGYGAPGSGGSSNFILQRCLGNIQANNTTWNNQPGTNGVTLGGFEVDFIDFNEPGPPPQVENSIDVTADLQAYGHGSIVTYVLMIDDETQGGSRGYCFIMLDNPIWNTKLPTTGNPQGYTLPLTHMEVTYHYKPYAGLFLAGD